MPNVVEAYYKDIIVPLENKVKEIEIKVKKSIFLKIFYYKQLNRYEMLLYNYYIEFGKVIEDYNF